jgi:signal transduction histidine kinase
MKESKIPKGTEITPREHLDNVVLQGARPMAVTLAVVFFIFIIVGLFELHGPPPLFELSLDVGMLVVSIAVVLALFRRWIPARKANLISVIVILLVYTNLILSALVVGSAYTLKFVPYLIIGAGALLLSSKWLALTLVPILALTAPLAWDLFSPLALLELSLHCVAGTAIAIALHLARRETHLRIHELRREDSLSKADLQMALVRSEETLRNYTETEEHRRALEAQLFQAQKMESVGVLAGGIAHGMNNLLGAISAYTSVVRDETPEGDPRRREMEEILLAAKRGGQLTRNLLGFARKGKFQRTIIDPNEVVDQTIDMIRPSLSKKLELDVTLYHASVLVYGDGIQLGQALMNLCLNSADAMPQGGTIYIITEAVVIGENPSGILSGYPPGRYSVIRVRDTGEGMDEETVEQAFDPFFTTKGPDKGTGLGLAMVYGAVRAHDGWINIDSAPGRGTTVTILLPAATDEQIASAPPTEKPSQPPPMPPGKRKRVLLVDDEPMIRSAGERLLKRLGCEVLLATNGLEAVEVVSTEVTNIDLVILDVAMPQMDGTECFYKLREIDDRLPIVISTGFADESHTEKLMADGANGLLPKPYEIDHMAEVLRLAN